MAQDTKKLDITSATPVLKDNLVAIQDSGKEKQVLEINRQMTALEAGIATLNKKLNSTNKKIKTDVDRLSTSEQSLSDKVADTYQQLGEIEVTFNTLNKQSNKITTDLKAVNSSIKSFEKTSTNALNTAIENQTEINAEFKQQHLDLITRAEAVSKKVSSITSKLNKSVKDNSKAITDLELKIVSELEQVSQLSQQRDESLDDSIKSASRLIDGQQARMLLMQSVDESLAKRATSLETVSAKLIADSEILQDTTETLDILTSKLAGDVEALEIHTARLQQQHIEQQGQITTLNDKTSSITRTLLALATLEKKHFRVFAITSFLLIIALLATFFYSQYRLDTEQAVVVQQSEVVSDQVAELETRVQDEQMASQVFYAEIIELQTNLNQVQQELKQKTAQIEQEMQQMNDEVESIDGRVQYLAPLYNFGTDNTIHGSQWLARLDASRMSIKIATVSDKQEMYQIAQRYNRYFTQDLAYYIDEKGQYILIYGGNFNDQQQVSESLRKMPRYMNFQQISAISNAEILQQMSL